MTITVNEKEYEIKEFSVRQIVGAADYLTSLDDKSKMQSLQDACFALSWLIQGNGGLSEELSRGTSREIADGLLKAVKKIPFECLANISAITKSLESLMARPRP